MRKLLLPILVLFAAAGLPLACAASVTPGGSAATEGAGGQGGAAGTTAASTTGAGGASGCLTAADCAAVSDACNVGACINSKCVKTAAAEGASCDDGLYCTNNDVCKDGACVGGSQKFCTSPDTCHLGVCDEVTKACGSAPGNDGAFCDDGDPCTLSGSCSSGACIGGKPIDCSNFDGPCTTGVCDPVTGCKAAPKNDGAPCDDGLFCTVSDACGGGSCKGQPNTCAAPGDVCMIGSCDELAKKCTAIPGNNGNACDDKNACTQGETCAAGKCLGGAPANVGGACDDKDPCTTVDVCNNAGVCVGGSAIGQCVGGDGCCPAACDLMTDSDCKPACCGDDMNPGPTANNCFQGATWIAWKYVPACSFNTTRIEIHSDAGNVALLADANGLPGAILFQGPLGPPDPGGWIGSNVAPPLALVGGATYWIAENVGVCSIAAQGSLPTYWGSFNTLAGPWMGPFTGNIWTSHVIGECGP